MIKQHDRATIFAKDFPGILLEKSTKMMWQSLPSAGRDVVMLCNFTLRLWHGREIAQPYRSWGLKIFASFLSASKIFSDGKPIIRQRLSKKP